MTSRGPAEDIPAEDTSLCPVPQDQRPVREYEQLRDSWFFAWPARDALGLARPLAGGWLLALLPCLLVAGGSYAMRHSPPLLALSGMVVALLLPLLLLVRQWLGWSYVRRRLVSERVEYEESGWYDGQVWEKPLPWRQRDLLVARHQVEPVLRRLRRALLLTIGLMGAGLILVGAGLCQAR